MKKEKSIEEQVVERLLMANEYPTEILDSIGYLREQIERKSYETKKFLELVPWLKDTNLTSSELKKTRKRLRKVIVETIHESTSEDIEWVNLFQLAILIEALDLVSCPSEDRRGINRKNENIAFCCYYIDFLYGRGNTEKDYFDYLKKF